MAEAIDIGTISARGQIAIPIEIREKMQLEEGEKVLFVLEGDSLVMKRVESLSWDQITRPLREAAKKAGLKESDVPNIVHKIRRQKQ